MRPAMILPAAILLAAATLVSRAPASSVPEPLFAGNPASFLEDLSRGQMSELLEVHLTQYAVDPAWAAQWAVGRYGKSGLLAGYGSVSSRALFQRLDLGLTLRASDRLQIRYDQRRWADTRFDLVEERFDALWWVTPGFALLGSGWPTPNKEDAALGLGGVLGRTSGRDQLAILVRDDRYVFNEKTNSNLRFTRKPLRLLLDGVSSRESWRLFGSLNLGTAYAAEDRPPGGPVRSTAGRLQYGNAGALWRRGPVRTSLTGRFVSQERSEDGGGSPALFLERDWWRIDGYLELAPGDWAGALLGGYARQRDRFFVTGDTAGEYRGRNSLFGAECIYRGWHDLELRLGYIGNAFQLERAGVALGPEPPSLADDLERGYADKVHLRGRYRFHPALALELLLSKEVSHGSFGGFSVRALGQL